MCILDRSFPVALVICESCKCVGNTPKIKIEEKKKPSLEAMLSFCFIVSMLSFKFRVQNVEGLERCEELSGRGISCKNTV